jgi:hypothetical protein
MSAQKAKERPAVSEPNALDEATLSATPSTWLESDAAENLTALAALALLLLFS